MLREIIGHADRRVRQLAHFAAAVLRLDLLDAALDLAHLGQVLVEALAIGGAEILAEARDFGADPVEDALVGTAALRTFGRRGADTKK